MSGSWEYPKPKVLIAMLTRELVSMAWALGFKELQYPENSTHTVFYGMPFDHARSSACQRMMEEGFDYLFFLDDDVIVPPQGIQQLIARNKDIISGLYCRRNLPITPVIMKEQPEKTAKWITDFKPGELIESDLAGTGCMLIKRKVLEIMDPPWFVWKCDQFRFPEASQWERCSEDYDFCRKARALGFKLWVDTGVQCMHCGLGTAMPNGQYQPLRLP